MLFPNILLLNQENAKRLFYSLTRLLLARTKNEDITKSILTQFKTKFNINCNSIEGRIKSSKNAYERYGALFPYKDVVCKNVKVFLYFSMYLF